MALNGIVAIALTLVGGVVPVDARTDDPRNISLVNQRREIFRLADLRRLPTVLTFVASRCTDACPIANAAFSELANQLRYDRIEARLVTITLDPEYDTPFVMARMARTFAAASQNWTFASGRPADVRRLMRALGVVAERGKSGVPDLHSSFVYVFDSRVRLKRTLLLVSGLRKDVELVLRSTR